MGHPAVISARPLLIGDTPAQAASDLETLTRWRAIHDLNSLVQPKSDAEAQWLRMRGKIRERGGVEDVLTYAMVLAYSHRCEEVIRLLDEAHRRYPLDVRVRTARVNVRMLAGDLSASVWAESWRGLCGEQRFTQPRWQGEPRPGHTILLWDDYDTGLGLGDATQMARLVPVVKAHSQATGILAVPAGMKRLFSSLRGVDAIVEPPLPTDGFDAQYSLTLLPSIPGCELTPARVSVVPYLFVEEEAMQRWAPTFAHRSRIHIGLHWRAEENHLSGRQRSLPVSALAPLSRSDQAQAPGRRRQASAHRQPGAQPRGCRR